MVTCIRICAFHLMIGDNVMLGGRYLTISDIRGSYEHGHGLMVEVCTQVGWHRLSAVTMLDVYRNV